MLEPGAVVGLYEVERELGGGGMARVYRVRHQVLGSVHALKVLDPELVVNAELRARFLDEGRIQAQLRHPNIVQVTDIVSVPGIAGLVMDFLEGESLEAFIDAREGKPPPADEVRDIFRQVLAGVGYAHGEGYVHRDLKPSNIFLQQVHGKRVARILDFGIAKAPGAEKRATRTGARLGTPHYMSPEQVKDPRDTTARSDIFSLGVTLYELATGRRCFSGDSDFLVMRSIVQNEFLPPERVYPGIDPSLAAAIRKAMAQDPEKRFATCAELAAALDAPPPPPPPAAEPPRKFTLADLQAVSPAAERPSPKPAPVKEAKPAPPPAPPPKPKAVEPPPKKKPPPPEKKPPKELSPATRRLLRGALMLVGLLLLYGALLVVLSMRRGSQPVAAPVATAPQPAPGVPVPVAAPKPPAPVWGRLSLDVIPKVGVRIELTNPQGDKSYLAAASVLNEQALPGRWKARAEALGHEPKELDFNVAAGAPTTVTLVLDPVAAPLPAPDTQPVAEATPPTGPETPPHAEPLAQTPPLSEPETQPGSDATPPTEPETQPVANDAPPDEAQPGTDSSPQAEPPPEPATGPQRFHVRDYALHDTRTGLLWTRHLSQPYSWQEALQYCSLLNLEGGGWRLPERREMAVVFRDGAARQELLNALVGDTNARLWSATTFPGGMSGELAWTAQLGTGELQGLRTVFQVRVLCVR